MGRPWTKAELRLLGTAPDEGLGRRMGRSLMAVRLKRQELQIEAPLQPQWSEEEIKLLGTAPDREIGRRLGRSWQAVQIKRLKLGIKPWKAKTSHRPRQVDPAKVVLRFGPYDPPRARRGACLVCERRGKVKVGNFSDAPIPWPRKWGTKSLILCGDLVRAVRQESELAVAHHWGVCTAVVSLWRATLDVGPITPGTTLLKSYVSTEMMTPALRARIAAAKTGKPRKLTKQAEARLMRALHRPKPQEWRRKMVRHWRARRGKPFRPGQKVWTDEEHSLIGTRPDKVVARMTGRSVRAVRARREVKRIPYLNPQVRKWAPREIKLIGVLPDHEVARRTGFSLNAVRRKRAKMGILIRRPRRLWTRAEERLLSRGPDTRVALRLKRSRADVRLRRIALGFEPWTPRTPHRMWTLEEDQLLGTDTDAAIAKLLGRTPFSVQLRRGRLGIRRRQVS